MNDSTRVLVCDDEEQILRALRVILRDAGYEAVTAATGASLLGGDCTSLCPRLRRTNGPCLRCRRR